MPGNRPKRSDIADRLAAHILHLGLTNPYGGDVTSRTSVKGFSYYEIAFSYPRTLDGLVIVLNEKKILVKSNRGEWEVTSEDDAIRVLNELAGKGEDSK